MNHSIAAIFITTICLLSCNSIEKTGSTHVGDMVRNNDLKSLQSLLNHKDKELQCAAAKALSWMQQPEAAAVQKRLIKLSTCDWRISSESIWRITARGKNVIESIQEGLGDPRPEIRWNTAYALMKHGDAEATDVLKKCVNDHDKYVAAWCQYALCKLLSQTNCKKPNMNLTNGKPAP